MAVTGDLESESQVAHRSDAQDEHTNQSQTPVKMRRVKQ
jgi:hypothetical protein